MRSTKWSVHWRFSSLVGPADLAGENERPDCLPGENKRLDGPPGRDADEDGRTIVTGEGGVCKLGAPRRTTASRRDAQGVAARAIVDPCSVALSTVAAAVLAREAVRTFILPTTDVAAAGCRSPVAGGARASIPLATAASSLATVVSSLWTMAAAATGATTTDGCTAWETARRSRYS